MSPAATASASSCPAPDHGVIVTVAPRRTLLYRSDAWRQKLFAANATQAIIVVATEPSFSDELVTRCIVAAEQQRMRVVIVLNKSDLADRMDTARRLLDPFRALGYPLVELSARRDAQALRPHLAGQCSVLVGQSAWASRRSSMPCCRRRRPPCARSPRRSIPASTPPPTPGSTASTPIRA
jgi:putative ribosome biogenesis GTPase RsgA